MNVCILSGGGGGAGAKPSNTGDKPGWQSLINILTAGGREAAGGIREVNFGPGVKRKNLLSAPVSSSYYYYHYRILYYHY